MKCNRSCSLTTEESRRIRREDLLGGRSNSIIDQKAEAYRQLRISAKDRTMRLKEDEEIAGR